MYKGNIKQRGFTLVEVGIVVLILTLVTAGKITSEINELRFALGKAQGQQLKVLNDGVYNYGVANFQAVINNTAVTGVAVTRAPTVAELNTLGYLSGGFNNNNYFGGNYITSITPAPVGCVPAQCNIAGLVYLSQPMRDSATGAVDGPAIGEAVNAIGADGGSSLTVGNTTKGRKGGWTLPNPLGNVPGILAARSGLGSQLDLAGYLRRDGTMPMTGNLDMGANSLGNLAVVVEGSACVNTGLMATDASGAVLTCQTGLYKRQGSTFWQDPVANVASLPACNATISGQTRVVRTPTTGAGPRAFTCTGASWIALAVDDTGNLTVANNLTVTARSTSNELLVNRVVVELSACAPTGLIARDASGLIMSCQSGLWHRAQGDTATLGAQGSTRLSSGVQIKWGSGAGGIGFYSFVSPFPTYCASVSFGSGGPFGSANGVPRGSCNVNGVSYSAANSNPTPFMYISIGW